MTKVKSAGLGLSDISAKSAAPIASEPSVAEATIPEKTLKIAKPKVDSGRRPVNYHMHPKVHDALSTIIFKERQEKTSFQTIITESLKLYFQSKQLPSYEEIESGAKEIKL